MFGTVARMQLKPGSEDRMRELAAAQEARNVAGFRFMATYRSTADPNETWLVVGFDDEASYRANADDPQTDEMARQMRELMVSPPEWHDGEVVAFRVAEAVEQLG